MAWIWLLFAAACEIIWALGLKQSAGLTKLWPSAYTIFFMLLSFVLLSQAMKSLPVGTAYAVWTGIGAIGTALFGILLFGEPHNLGRIISLLLVIGGVIGLRYFAAAP
ncbi:MAG TPA: multidrug efflux SMR transporter [Trueperaceae bacterium]